MKIYSLLALLALLVGCAEAESGSGPGQNTNNGTMPTEDACLDNDLDGYFGRTSACPNGTDCNDFDANINAGATEIPGNGIDENCDSMDGMREVECDDADGDGFRDEACGGTDCNDSNPDVNPRATETCGNSVDEDCDGMDLECAEGCFDEDGDGYGTDGSTGCPGGDEIDCNDNDASINPGAAEICNQIDDNCNDETDECGLEGQVCVDGSCQGGAGAQCENNNECAGSSLTCDFTQSPKVCKANEDGACATTDDCVNGLVCEGNVCTGDFCAVNTCSGDYAHCNDEGGYCSECPYWDVQNADAACSGLEQCAPGGWCAANFDILTSDPIEGSDTTDDLLWVSIAIAECWMDKKPAGDKDMCYAMWIFNDVTRTITESMVEDAYVDGDLDGLLFEDEDDALKDVWGVGLFNLKEMEWKADMVPGTAKEVCIWYQPGGFFGGEAIVVDRCENFSP